ncbi:hypothetical protein RQP46_003021 [Phenoliferia psychrophenolica]
MAPDRRLDLDLPALIRLADVPGFGEAWEKLPPFAPARLEQLALEADLDLIYDKNRSKECFLKASEYQQYHFYSSPAARTYEKGWLDSFLSAQLQLSQRWLLGRLKSLALWRATDVRRREEIFITARTAHAKDRGDRTYLLHCPELRIDKLCGGNGEGFGELLNQITFSIDELRGGVPTSPRRLKHEQWDRWFGLDDAASDQLPLPAGLRGFAINVLVFRMGLLMGTAEMMLKSLEDGGTPKPSMVAVAVLSYLDDLETSLDSVRMGGAREVDPGTGQKMMNLTLAAHISSASRPVSEESNTPS